MTSYVNKHGGGVNDLLHPLNNMQITELVCNLIDIHTSLIDM